MGVFGEDGVVKCPVMKGLKLTAAEMLRWKALSDRVTRFDAKQ